MPTKTTTKAAAKKVVPKSAVPKTGTAKTAPAAKRPAKSAASPRMSLAEVMTTLERCGREQTRKTWARHGATEPMFGVSFADMAKLLKRIGVDHELAQKLWDTRNADARTLALKVADPARMTSDDLDRWLDETTWGMQVNYVAQLASETSLGAAKAKQWLAKPAGPRGPAGWSLVGQLAARDASIPDAWFADRVAEIERTIGTAPNGVRDAMNRALITIGGRSPALRDAACAAAKRIGKVDVDYGDTACKTPDAKSYIEKMWAHAKAKGFPTPSVQEQNREPMRLRC